MAWILDFLEDTFVNNTDLETMDRAFGSDLS